MVPASHFWGYLNRGSFDSTASAPSRQIQTLTDSGIRAGLSRRGWIKIEAENVDDLWHEKLRRWDKSDEVACSEQEIDGCKDYWYELL